jgi:hypothetical protein
MGYARKDVEMNDFTEEELFELYKNAFEDAEDRGLDYDGCKQVAYDAIVEDGGAPSFTLSGRIGRWHQIRNYKKAHKPSESVKIDKPQSYWDTLNWKDCWRTACETGFIPHREYVEAFLPESKTIQWSAYKNFMQSEGWIFEDVGWGWQVTNPKTLRRVQLIDQIEKLKAELETL